MSDAKKPPPPADLGDAGATLWRDIAEKWDLRPDELRILHDACSEADLIDDLAAEAKHAPKMVKGSQGQDVINPMISELRQHRATLKSLLGALQLPDESGQESSRSVSARKAAQSRWGKSA